MRSLIVIPARLASTRLSRKMLLSETGKPLIQHTYEAALQASRAEGVCVATDAEEIVATIGQFGGTAQMTSEACASGTDRVAEVARSRPEIDLFVNVQGDEPELAGASIDKVIDLLEQHPEAPMATLATPIRDRVALDDPACVKVVCDTSGRAIYFSRAAIPHARQWNPELLAAEPPVYWQHLGIYAYRRDFLLQMAELRPTPLESLESLEQLRVLEHGHTILVGRVDQATRGIDTEDDYRGFVARQRNG
ncbi:MAG: 3-deoxy-manno-octulosonate cytidylyltransferase [Planctomycetales bacterium]|nr:3-deoxy-manno-octulosonate cytidylyltransferase [Planctomycetales bacterium]